METEARGGAEAGHKAWCFAPRPGSAEAGSRIQSEGLQTLNLSGGDAVTSPINS